MFEKETIIFDEREDSDTAHKDITDWKIPSKKGLTFVAMSHSITTIPELVLSKTKYQASIVVIWQKK